MLPQTVAGSHDPLFEWALSASGCGLANACFGSTDGLDRLVDHRACAALLHLPDARTPGFNLEALQARPPSFRWSPCTGRGASRACCSLPGTRLESVGFRT
ncbi:MAG: hypothetical protein R3E48_01695 [Burkholderiaceae bacterium]